MTVTIERLGHAGDGIADGPIFVPRTLPGEVVNGDVIGGRMDAPRIVTPSADRIRPKCPAYQRCGGCALHHAAPDFVQNWKGAVVRQALSAHGVKAPIRQFHSSPPNSRRRAKLTGRRTKKGATVGFFAPRSDVLHDISGCLTLSPAITEKIPALQAFTSDFGSRRGVLQFWVLETAAGLDVAVDGLDADPGQFEAFAHWAQTHQIARLTIQDETVVTLQMPSLRFGNVIVAPPPRGFTQATAQAELFLQNAVRDAVGPSTQILDLFAGLGTLGLPLATQAAVHAVEGDAGLLSAIDTGMRHATGVKPVRTEKRDLFKSPIPANEMADYDAVIVDPPRAGASAQVAQIAQSQVPVVAMVSCNPITFAADAAVLCSAGFELDWIDVVDQFRWSTHIEVAAKFSR